MKTPKAEAVKKAEPKVKIKPAPIRLDKLMAVRTLNGKSQADMADYLGLSAAAYCYKEAGKADFTATEIVKIKELFNLSIEDAWTILFENRDASVKDRPLYLQKTAWMQAEGKAE